MTTDSNFDTDPFTAVLQAIWKILDEHDGFSRLVKLGNRWADGVPQDAPTRAGLAMDADRPEVNLVPVDLGDIVTTSTGFTFVQRYALVLNTGDDKATDTIFPLKWEAIKALLPHRKLDELAYVKEMELIAIDDTFVDGEEEETGFAPGWTATIGVAVKMYFKQAVLAGQKREG